MSDKFIYDEIDDEEPKRTGSWEYVNCNWIWVPEYVDDDDLPTDDEEDDIPEGN